MVDMKGGRTQSKKDLKEGRTLREEGHEGRKDTKGGMTQGEEGNQGRKDTRRDEMINNYSQNVHIFLTA